MRYSELDIGRSIAVIAMIAYHALFDITYFKTGQAPAVVVAFAIAGSFMFISGICTHISWHRYRSIKPIVWRSAKLAAAAGIITALSFLLLRGGWIIFGILHFFALAGVLAIPLLRLRGGALALIAMSCFALATVGNTNPYLLWLLPTSFATFDYFPLLPWLGVYAFGIYFGRLIYPDGERSFKWQLKFGPLEWVGRHSLLIYFMHQPIIIAVLWFLGFGVPMDILR
ncbi:MAG: heparan-alpha-glucosaminide N-acetyltransferase [Candidatus Aenigmatarchaeota archaeon]|nr:DUF1624 domain-containing protein [Candidatus Aenigmarchaeota archaeon]